MLCHIIVILDEVFMRIGISKSKNKINYYIIKDYTKNGKKSTKYVLRIGNPEEVKNMAGDIDYIFDLRIMWRSIMKTL